MQLAKKFKWFLSHVCIAGLFALPVCAQDNLDTGDSLNHKFSIGLASAVTPKFEGADSHRVRAFPLLTYSNQYVFLSTIQGAGANVFRTDEFTAGPLLNYRFGRKENASSQLYGMGDVDGGVEAGAFADWQFHQQFGADLRLLQGLGDAKGFTADLGLTYRHLVAEDLFFLLRAGTVFADSEYNKQFFGVTGRQSQRTGYDRYDPNSGFKEVSLRPMLNYTFWENYNVGAFYEYKRLTGPAYDSPLVKRGSPNQNSAGISFSWHY